MYFLVSYDLIDRVDLSLTQKMTAIYLARLLDENEVESAISEYDLAQKMKLSVDEVKLNIGVLVEKGVIWAPDDENKSSLSFKKPLFKDLGDETLESQADENKGENQNSRETHSEEARDYESEAALLEAVLRFTQVDKKQVPRYELEKSLDEGLVEKPKKDAAPIDLELESGYLDAEKDEIFAHIDSVEQRIKERAAKLKVRGLGAKQIESDNANKKLAVDETPDAEELLDLLAQSLEEPKEEKKKSRLNQTKLSPQNRAFLRASSVYKRSKKSADNAGLADGDEDKTIKI